MYVLKLYGHLADIPVGADAVPTLEEAFARICCHCGLFYKFDGNIKFIKNLKNVG